MGFIRKLIEQYRRLQTGQDRLGDAVTASMGAAR